MAFFYIICALLIYWMCKLAQLAECSDVNPHDLGSSPRSTLISILFCNTYSYAVSKVERTIHSQDPVIHALVTSIKRFRFKAYGRPWSKVPHGVWKSQWTWRSLGSNSWATPPIWGLIPPWFATSFNFLYFLFLL